VAHLYHPKITPNYDKKRTIMSKIISIHDYRLKTEIPPSDFEHAVRSARERKLFDIPGLVDYHFIKGIKGVRCDCYTALWIYESRAAWEMLWGTPERPRLKAAYPAKWLIWEDELLAPLLIEEPDLIAFTSYEELAFPE